MPGEGDDIIGVNQIRGTSYDDTLVGSDLADWIEGFGGHDLMDGAGGDDDLGADGGDHVIGGAGRDAIRSVGGGNEIDAADDEVDTVDCGFWTGDVLNVDPIDVLTNCPG
jgi:Ca2+-binding RTX toxin-like protein